MTLRFLRCPCRVQSCLKMVFVFILQTNICSDVQGSHERVQEPLGN